MADAKLTALSATTTPVSTDIAYIVTDPGGTPASNKVTIGNMFAKAHGVLTTLGDSIYGAASGVLTRLAGNTTTTKKFLRQTGDGANSAAPAWDTVTAADVGLGNVTNESKATMFTSPTFSAPVLGTPASGTLTNCTGLPEGGLSLTDLTTANASATAHGFLPKWPNNTTTFFRGDGTYAAPTSVYARGVTKVVAASNSLDVTNYDYLCDGTDDQVQIQAAIDAVTALGGTVILSNGTFNISASIIIKSNVSLVGQGATATTLKRTANNIIIINNTGATSNDITIASMQFDGNSTSNTYNIFFSVGSSYRIKIFGNKFINSGAVAYFGRAYHMDIYSNEIYVSGTITDLVIGGINSQSIFHNNFIESSTNDGTSTLIRVDGYETAYVNNTFYNITSAGATTKHCIQAGSLGKGIVTISGNLFYGGGYTINMSDVHGWIVTDNKFYAFKNHAIYLSAAYNNNISNNLFYNSASASYSGVYLADATCIRNLVGGNTYYTSDSENINYVAYEANSGASENLLERNSAPSENSTGAAFLSSEKSQSFNNIGLKTAKVDTRVNIRMKNTSGGDLLAGNVVVLKSVAAGDEFTTSTTAGDSKVLGVLAESIVNNAFGLVNISGKTSLLKVNGTTDIAIGDFISQFTTAGIGQKALNGHTAIAIALEAYSADDSNGVIDALLIPPFVVGAAGSGVNTDITSLNATIGATTPTTGVFTKLSTTKADVTLTASATAIAITSNVMKVTGDAGGNTIATITGGVSGQVLVLKFVDALVTITDDTTEGANTVNLSAAFTSADGTILTLVHDGTSWLEIARSVNG